MPGEHDLYRISQPSSVGRRLLIGIMLLLFIGVIGATSWMLIRGHDDAIKAANEDDTGNVAAKLEAQSKQLDCTLVASVAALNMVARDITYIETNIVAIAGKTDPVVVAVFRNKSELEQILSSPG